MSKTITPAAWTGWPPTRVMTWEGEPLPGQPRDSRVVVVEATIGGMSFAQAVAVSDGDEEDAAAMAIDLICGQMFGFMQAHYRQELLKRRGEIAAMMDGR